MIGVLTYHPGHRLKETAARVATDMSESESASAEKVMPAFDGATPEMLPDKDKMYFNDYATLVQQQGMLQDHVRTSIYQFAVYENKEDFRGKRVLDVGAGTGILSFFAAKAGAAQVYAVEASGMALKAEKLAAGNGLQNVVTVINKRVEEVTLDEKVDVLISEPLGIALVNERCAPPRPRRAPSAAARACASAARARLLLTPPVWATWPTA